MLIQLQLEREKKSKIYPWILIYIYVVNGRDANIFFFLSIFSGLACVTNKKFIQLLCVCYSESAAHIHKQFQNYKRLRCAHFASLPLYVRVKRRVETGGQHLSLTSFWKSITSNLIFAFYFCCRNENFQCFFFSLFNFSYLILCWAPCKHSNRQLIPTLPNSHI